MASFESIFPTFLAKCAELHTLLLSVAYALFVTGVITTVMHHISHRAVIQLMVRLLMLTCLLVFLPSWGNTVQQTLQNSILSGLGVDPSDVYNQYNQLLIIKRDSTTEYSWWNVIGQLNSFTNDLFISAILLVIGYIASFLLFWAYIFQKAILSIGYALSPLLIGFMAIHSLKPTGARYLLNLVGVLLWPLGWAVAALVTQGVLDFMSDTSFQYFDPTSTLPNLQRSFGAAVVGFWIIFSTISSPIIIQKVIAHGIQAGGALLHGGVSGFLQTAATTVGAAAVASGAGKPLAVMGAAGLAAAMSTVSTAAGAGSAGGIIIAGSGLPPRTLGRPRGRSTDDITGDKAVRDLIAKSKQNYF
jgi:hypothetical protein